MENRTINLLQFRGNGSTLFTGRDQGGQARKKLLLDSNDKTETTVSIIIPKGTTSFNPSFYLGMLFKSIKKLGIKDFENKYKFIIEDSQIIVVNNILLKNLEDAKRNAISSLDKDDLFKRLSNL